MQHVHRQGTGDPALFLHGFPLHHGMWSAQLDALSDVAMCLAPDLAGFGRSAGVDLGAERALSMERHADDAARLLDAEGIDRADVIALSMGGYAALALCERHPDRVRSLALVDTKMTADDEAGRAAREAGIDALLEGDRASFARGMLGKLVAPSASARVRARLRTMIESTPYETIVAALEAMRDRPDRTDVLASLDVPVLVVCGEKDTLTPPPLAEAMAEIAPRGRLVLIPGAGHMAPMEAPEAVSAALRGHLESRD